MAERFDPLALDNQLCFPLYAAAKEIVRRYGPFLEDIDLTYTQYITMMVLWEEKTVSSKHLGRRLHLNSGTLTPLLKKLEAKGLIERKRSAEDERVLDLRITPQGEALRERALGVPAQMSSCIQLSPEEAVALRNLLAKLMDNLEASE